MKNCWECKFIYWQAGSAGYSEYTPSTPIILECRKKYWYMDEYGDSQESARTKLESAETCKDFKHYKETD